MAGQTTTVSFISLLLFSAVTSQSIFDVTLISSDTTPEVTAAVQLAVDHVNTSPYVNLMGYSINLTVAETVCDHRGSQKAFRETLLTQPYQVGTIGAGCSEGSIGVAEFAQHFSIPMVSYASTSQELSNRDEFPTFFRTVPSDKIASNGITGFITFYDWSRVVVLSQNTEQFRLETIELVRDLQEMNISVTPHLLLPEEFDPNRPSSYFPPDNRIFVLNMEAVHAVHVICEAVKMDLNRYDYIWILQGWYPEDWWMNTNGVDCNATSLASFLLDQGAISIDYYPLVLNTTVPADITGLTPLELYEAIDSTSPVGGYAYDSVLTLALGLNQTLSESNVTLTDPDSLEAFRQGVVESLNELQEFQGVSGNVTFKDGARSLSSVSVRQYRDCDGEVCMQPVGTISLLNPDAMVDFIENETEFLWGPRVPSDGAPLVVELFPYLWLTISAYVFASLVIVGAVISMIFTCVFRKRKLVRLTSPNMNLLIAFGVIIFNAAVFLFAYPKVSEQVLVVFCALRVWLISFGISLCFGTVSAKMWRIYYIFHNPNPAKRKHPLKDWHLALIVMIFVVLDLILLTLVSIFETARLAPSRVRDIEHAPTINEDGITVNYEVNLCVSDRRLSWLVILFGYKAIIQAIGLFLALRIRNIKIKVLNDSKEIAATLYLSSAILAVVLVISVALEDRLNVYTGAYAYGIPLSTAVVLIVVFFTKMVRLYKDPWGEKIFTHAPQSGTLIETSPKMGSLPSVVGNTVDLNENKVHTLEKQVRSLRVQLAKCKLEESIAENSDIGNETAVTIVLDTTIDEHTNGDAGEVTSLKNESYTDNEPEHQESSVAI